MDGVINVAIGIQARLNSSRFPNKILEVIGTKRMIDHVVDLCKSSQSHINRQTWRHSINVDLAILAPESEYEQFSGLTTVPTFYGPEDDVLTRYDRLLDLTPKYIVRVTSDCPMLPSELLTKHIMIAVKHRLDYISNVDTRFRTAPDGYDVEVISKDLFDYVLQNAISADDREHVTTFIRHSPPNWARIAHVVHNMDESEYKYSVDTPKDLEIVKRKYNLKQDKMRLLKRTKDGIFKY